jgi:hypothetical protein
VRSASISVVIAGVAVLGAWLSKWVSAHIRPAYRANTTN